jgi:outer membrane lipoprotein-sorting protein
MKKFSLLFTAILFTAAVSAQNSTRARAILDNARITYEQSNGVSFNFKIVTADANGKSYPAQSGKAMAKRNKFKLEMPDVETWFDGTTQWVWVKSTNEVNISRPTNEELTSISPTVLLNLYKNGFALTDPVSKSINGKSASVIKLMPTSTRSDFKQISIAIDTKNNAVVQIQTWTKDNSRNTIDITNYNTNNNFSDSMFVFDKSKHPGAEIIDLR